MKKLLVTIILLFAVTASAFAESGIKIAIIDTGISSVAISKDKIAEGKNYIVENGSTEDTVGHGTGIASIIVGSPKAYLAGICEDAVLVPLVFYARENNLTTKGDVALLAQMIRDAKDVYDCDIINISSGVKTYTPALFDAIEYVGDKGTLVVSAAGNDGDDTVYYPGAFENVLCIGGLNQEKTAAWEDSNAHSGVDILTPGEKVYVSSMKGNRMVVDGTSYSAAWASGAVAKLMSEYPYLTAVRAGQILCATADDLGEVGFDNQNGYGRLNMKIAREYAAAGQLFRDVKSEDWFFENVNFCVDRHLIDGTSKADFSPQEMLTRAVLVEALYRLEGKPDVDVAVSFEDVAPGSDFADAISWAKQNGIVNGETETKFAPDSNITREQIAAIVYRYAFFKGYPAADYENTDISSYDDATAVSDYAKTAVQYAVGSNLMKGKSAQTLCPKDNITRAEISAVLQRFVTGN
ncbi:MAG: S8 family serine peptidase [Oscillospiraceae bacterium]|nr:S8 family serine peptidase [Oscillospiraceae bacterium]